MKMQRLFFGFIGSVLFCGMAVAGGGEPYLAELVYGTKDLVPVVSFDVTKPPYSVDPTGTNDCTAGFAAALSDAEQHGGTVFAPAGRYRIDGVLHVPSGVTLRGDWKEPTEDDARVGGTILLAYAGRGSVKGEAFISVDQGGVRDLSIFYPRQKATRIEPYPYAVNLIGSAAVKNITLVNPYRGVLTGSFSTVMNLYGTPLDSGLTMLHAASVPRCRDVNLSPRYWTESGLENAPDKLRLRRILSDREALGIQLNRQDAGIFINIKIDGYHTGLMFMPPHGWTYWHNVVIENADVGIHFTGGSSHRAYMTGCSIEADRYGVLMEKDDRRWESDWGQYSKGGKAYGTPKDSAYLRMFDCVIKADETGIYMDGSFRQAINLQECTFAKWGRGSREAAISGEADSVVVYDCEFKRREHHIRLKGNPRTLELVGNDFRGDPDIRTPNVAGEIIDHTAARDLRRSMKPIQPVPELLPARTGSNSLYVVTAAPFNAPADGIGDAVAAIQSALDQAGRDGGGTVYLPQGSYRVTRHLQVPAGVELRGSNDFMPRGTQVRTMLVADLPADRGNPDNEPLISLNSSEQLGGSGVAGLGLWYPHQDYRKIDAYPWTIRSLGPACWVDRVFLGNCYNAIDFASHDSDRHVLSRICGSALNIAFRVGHSKTIGWIDNCHIRPQDWTLANPNLKRSKKTGKMEGGYVFDIPGDEYAKPTTKQIFRGTEYSLIPNMRGAGTITIGSGANEQITAFFCNGATRAFDFVDHDGSGGGSANILIGGSEAGWGAWVKALDRKGVTIVNFSFNPMTRLDYVSPEDIPDGQLSKGLVMRIDSTVSDKTPIDMIMPMFYGRKDVDFGVELYGGNLYFKQGMISAYRNSVIKRVGGEFTQRNTPTGGLVEDAD